MRLFLMLCLFGLISSLTAQVDQLQEQAATATDPLSARQLCQQAITQTVDPPIDAPTFSEAWFQAVASANTQAPDQLQVSLMLLQYHSKKAYQQDNDIDLLRQAYWARRTLFTVLAQQAQTSTVSTQRWYINRLEALWLKMLDDARQLERLTQHPIYWQEAFNALQKLRVLRLGFRQKSNYPLSGKRQFQGKLAKWFERLYTAQKVLPTATQISTALPYRTAILEYELIDNILIIFYIDQDGMGISKKQVNRKKLRQATQTLHQQLKSPKEGAIDTLYTQAAYFLYQEILATSLQQSRGIEHFIISPDEELTQIPFEALLTESVKPDDTIDSLNYVIQQTAISYTYTSALLSDTVAIIAQNSQADKTLLQAFEQAQKTEKSDIFAWQIAQQENSRKHPAKWTNWRYLGNPRPAPIQGTGGSSAVMMLLCCLALGAGLFLTKPTP